jgi:hypothetical protein
MKHQEGRAEIPVTGLTAPHIAKSVDNHPLTKASQTKYGLFVFINKVIILILF